MKKTKTDISSQTLPLLQRNDLQGLDFHEKLRQLPKIDLHRHMEGSLRLETLAEVAHEHGVNLPSYNIEELRPYVQFTDDVPDFYNFLGKMELLRQFYSAGEAVERIAYEAVADAAHDNIQYLELRVSPAGKKIRPEEVMRNVTTAVEKAIKEYPIQVRLLITIVREFGVKVAEEILELALAYQEQGVVGLDLAGHEETHSALPFADIFHKAHKAGLGVTIHAGEVGDATNVRQAVEVLGAHRIGHGVRAIEDHRVVRLLRERNVALEVCPTSNLQTGVTRAFAQHPMRDLYHLAVPVTINTDDPSISDTTLTDEYLVVVLGMGLAVRDIQQMILNAAQAAFLPPDEKQALIQQFQGYFGL
jgi:adenosine deaminase